jgi:hypothetical protein
VSSHLAFLPAVVVALVRGLYDAVVLIAVMVFLSIWYHREAEKPQFLAKIELCSTCALFIYGASQGLYAPSAPMLAAEVICASITVSTSIAGFSFPSTSIFMTGGTRSDSTWCPQRGLFWWLRFMRARGLQTDLLSSLTRRLL